MDSVRREIQHRCGSGIGYGPHVRRNRRAAKRSIRQRVRQLALVD
jgi:hypothetical protein